MSEYALVHRSPDNSDGIYDASGQQIASLRQLEARGYSLYYLLSCNEQRLAQIARAVSESDRC